MAFKTWQIGLHIQQQEALAVAIVRGASGWSLQRWWRLPLMNVSTAEGGFLTCNHWLMYYGPGAANCRYVIVFTSLFPHIGHSNVLFPIRRCACANANKPYGFRKRWRVSWIWIRTYYASIFRTMR